jgi:GT2 family glycosyltransferase
MTVNIDLVTVYHNETNRQQHLALRDAVAEHEPNGGYRYIGVDNRTCNRGFAAGCNLGAFHPEATAPIIGFLNPDVTVSGPFIATVKASLKPPVVITGCRYGKSAHELDLWGVTDWVCGAAFFVERKWFQAVGGFDVQFVWSWEETDLIRQAQDQGLRCQSIELPIGHQSPTEDEPKDVTYKRYNFDQGQKRFARKWGRRRI